MATIKNLKRMCDSYKKCDDCPLGYTRCGDSISALYDNADEIVDKWVLEHPIKTYAMDFFEKFPNAPKDRNGAPLAWMSRLIDAEALTEKLKEWLKDKETSRGRGTAEEIWCNDAEIDILDAIIEDISRMPTVEAKPIIHAKWVSSKIPGSILSECSHCNFGCGAYSYEYCPYCGAKMDGEENESS